MLTLLVFLPPAHYVKMLRWLKERIRDLWKNLFQIVLPNILLKWTTRKLELEEDCIGKVFIVTGANCGLGEATCLQLAKKGAVVVLGCRNLILGRFALQKIQTETKSTRLHLFHVDLSDLNSVRKFAHEIKEKFKKIHCLINNAGVYRNEKLERTNNGLEIHFATNHLGPMLLTKLLIPYLARSPCSRVVNVSSLNAVMSRPDFISDVNYERRDDFGFMGTGPYNDSKMAICLITKQMALRYPHIQFYSINPGLIRSNVFDNSTLLYKLIIWSLFPVASISPQQAALGVLYVALCEGLRPESGSFYHAYKKHRAVNQLVNSSATQKMWQISHNFLGLSENTKRYE